MPLEVAAPVAFMSLAPIGGKVAMPALFKAGVAGKTVGATFAGVKGGSVGASKGFAAKGGILTKTSEKATTTTHASGDEEEKAKQALAFFAMLTGIGKPASDVLEAERKKCRRVALSRRGDRSRLYGEFL